MFDWFKFWQEDQRNRASAAQVKPAAYRLLDQMESAYDQLSNSTSLSPYSAMTELKHLELGDKLEKGLLGSIEQQAYQILSQGSMQKMFAPSGAAGAIAGIANAQFQQDAIKKLVESKTNLFEHRMQSLVQVMYENALQDEISKQANKLAASDMASANGYSEEKINALQGLERETTTMTPEDLEFKIA